MLFEGLLLGKKKGAKKIGYWEPPPPPYSGNARKKTFFLIDLFPNIPSLGQKIVEFFWWRDSKTVSNCKLFCLKK